MKWQFTIWIQLIFLSFFCSISFAQWETQDSGVSVNLIDVSFVDSLNGCIIGDSSTILITHDGGKNWAKKACPVDTIRFTKVQLVKPFKGYIIGEEGLFLSTSDGGESWTKIETGYNYNFSDISFVDSLNGWMSCWLETQTERIGVILHTDDGGITWTKQVEKISNQLFNSTLFMAIKFLNNNVGWAFGGNYADGFSETYLYSTSNGGISWNIVGQPQTGPLYELNISSGDTLWGSKWQFATSYNAGVDWTFLENNTVGSFGAASPINGLSGWIRYYNFDTKKNVLYFTSNAGISWSEVFNLENSVVSSMTNINGKYLWIVGDNGFIKRWSEIATGVESKEFALNNEYYLYQNYPNPFNPTTKIKYTLSYSSDVKIIIYDITGREIEVLINQSQKEGTYEVVYTPKHSSSGIYFYKIIVNNTELTRKMILMK